MEASGAIPWLPPRDPSNFPTLLIALIDKLPEAGDGRRHAPDAAAGRPTTRRFHAHQNGQPASTGKVNFDVSGNQGPEVHTLAQTAVVTPGKHTIGAQFAGSSDPSVNFTLLNWNLIVHGVPST
jgi:hypothetical protein